jgi:hypothetical protein
LLDAGFGWVPPQEIFLTLKERARQYRSHNLYQAGKQNPDQIVQSRDFATVE